MSLFAFVTVFDNGDGRLRAQWRMEDGRSGSDFVAGFAEIRRMLRMKGATEIEIRREES